MDLVSPVQPPSPLLRRDGMWFTPKHPNTFARKHPIDVVTIHWTGAENPAERVYKTLVSRRLSIHAIIERDGTIVQTADWQKTACAHVGNRRDRPVSLNLRSIGIEVVGRGFATKGDLPRTRGLRARDAADWAVTRPIYEAGISKRRKMLAGFTHRQVLSVLWLCDALTTTYDIPRIIPWKYGPEGPQARSLGGNEWILPAHDRDASHKPGSRRTSFRGVLGHYHVHATRWDPGPQIFNALWDRGYHPTEGMRRVA
ncbi:MAG: peptidoglycan recognition family protein [Bacteroidota bacterium]